MSAWQNLVTAALVGTERQSPRQGANGDHGLKAEATEITNPFGLPGISVSAMESAEAGLLQAAAALSVYRLAGGKSGITVGDCTPAGPETIRIGGARSAVHLDLILNGPHGELLEEWLAAAAANQKRAAATNLPDLLDVGAKKRALRSMIRPVLGERGRWLAAQNPDWAWALTPADIESDSAGEVWETGTGEDRRAALEALRAVDPARGRAMVESTWDSDSPEDRAEFIERLRPDLSLADEPLLERALDDRRKDVRRMAADLLCLLPGSALSQRMVRRVEALIGLKRAGLLGGERIEVDLPEASDPAMVRDGIDAKPNEPGLGEKAAWLKQMLSRIPPSYWTRAWGRTPEQIIQTAAKGEWRDALVGGWVEAVIRFRDPVWAEAIMHWCTRTSDDKGQAHQWMVAVMRTVPASKVDSFAEELIGAGGLDTASALLPGIQNPWTARLTGRVVNAIGGRMHKGGPNAYVVAYQIREILKLARQYAAPSMYSEAMEALRDAPSEIMKAVDEFLMTLRLRSEMVRALKED